MEYAQILLNLLYFIIILYGLSEYNKNKEADDTVFDIAAFEQHDFL